MKAFTILLLASIVILATGYCALAPDLSELQNDIQAYQTKSLLPEEN